MDENLVVMSRLLDGCVAFRSQCWPTIVFVKCSHCLWVTSAQAEGAAAAASSSGGAISFAKATFAAAGSDQALDLNDPAFWEKVLGPKPAQRMLHDLTEGKLEDSTEEYQTKLVGGECDRLEWAGRLMHSVGDRFHASLHWCLWSRL